MRTSIALATFNGQDWLDQFLQSLADQTRLPDELVISDDVSSDATLSIVRRYAEYASFPVVLIENTVRVGYSANFERALSRCTGDLVFLADQDDEWLPRKIEKVALAMGDADLAFHDAAFIDSEGEVHAPTMFDRLRMMGRSPDWAVKGCCSIVSQSLVQRALPLPLEEAHDAWLHRLSKETGRRVIIDEPLIRYRIHGKNTSRSVLNTLDPPNVGVHARVRRCLSRVTYRGWRFLRGSTG